MDKIILLCTVGGSHEPVCTAIRENNPDFVCFFVTSGSLTQITGKGKIIKAKPDDAKPTLPNISAQAQLDEHSFKCVQVEADDLDKVFFSMRDALVELRQRYPNAQFIADYTGGTKTMSAALVNVALKAEDVELQLVTGRRDNLQVVKPGSEQAIGASIAGIRLHREIELRLSAWHRFGYQEAADGLQRIRTRVGVPGLDQLGVAKALSRTFALWDNFDHVGARAQLEGCEKHVRQCRVEFLSLLTNENKPANKPARLFDLWLNAERRAVQGRYDDAVGRWYRLMEWTAQWQLESKLDVDTADLQEDMIPVGSNASSGSEGKIKVGLRDAWKIIEERLTDDTAGKFIHQHYKSLLDKTQRRNQSILAHGFNPVSRQQWEQICAWTQEHFLLLLDELGQEVGLRSGPEQLPTELTDFN